MVSSKRSSVGAVEAVLIGQIAKKVELKRPAAVLEIGIKKQ
jgi:hypothetical protein